MEKTNEGKLRPKPRLFCIEGPAGIGKSTLCGALAQKLRAAGVAFSAVDEFSATPLGIELGIRLSRFSHSSVMWSAMETMMLCVVDKFTSISLASKANAQVMLLDRGFITQCALAVPYIVDLDEKAHAEAIIGQFNDWLSGQFDVTTLLLQLPSALNVSRLEKRLRRNLDEDERWSLLREIECYANLSSSPSSSLLGFQFLNTRTGPEELADDVMADFLGFEIEI